MTPQDFRKRFPEFGCTTDYPDPQVGFWIDLAGIMLNPDKWADALDYGKGLFVAHHLAISSRDQKTAEAGGAIGTVNGPQTAKSVDKVSASYDTSAVTYENAGFWNSTMYGIRLFQLARMMGAGGIQL